MRFYDDIIQGSLFGAKNLAHSVRMQSTHCLQRKYPLKRINSQPVNFEGRKARNPSLEAQLFIQPHYQFVPKTLNNSAVSQRKTKAFLRLQRLRMKEVFAESK
jgi:hypothetical protein